MSVVVEVVFLVVRVTSDERDQLPWFDVNVEDFHQPSDHYQNIQMPETSGF